MSEMVDVSWNKGISQFEKAKLELVWRLAQTFPESALKDELKKLPEFDGSHPVYGEFEASRYMVVVLDKGWRPS